MREVKDDHFIVFIFLTLNIGWYDTQIIEEEERSDINTQPLPSEINTQLTVLGRRG